ncbi:MAG: ABC transporter permease [Flavobacteriaceae bacterium]|nr:ABC transporter permease [Flavobacteriaceae bacterium]
MLIYLRVLKESFNFAFNALRNNKLRTFLSLLGVTIGIFSIIGVLAAVDSLKHEIEGSLSALDKSTLYLARFSFGPTDIPNWKREQFPDVTYEEYQFLKRSVPDLKAISFALNVNPETVKFEDRSVSNVDIAAVSYEYYDIEALQIAEGRFYNESESNSGSPVIVIGDEIAASLFGNAQIAIGKRLRLYGRRFTVIGVLKKEGTGLFGNSKDTAVMLPANMARKFFGSNSRFTFPAIIIKPEKGVDTEGFIAVLTQKLRNYRGIKYGEGENFFINRLAGFTDLIDNMIGTLNILGFAISFFSLLVGGFGIANIMFVSVKERTNLIGIQKSLGAKNKFILLQFLFEAVILAVIGGLVGLLLVYLIVVITTQLGTDFEFILSTWNIILGASISTLIGLISGIIPAISASKLDPVEAIRSGY